MRVLLYFVALLSLGIGIFLNYLAFRGIFAGDYGPAILLIPGIAMSYIAGALFGGAREY